MLTTPDKCENCTRNMATRVIRGDKIVDGKWAGATERKVCGYCCTRVAEKLIADGYVTAIGNIC